MNEMLHSLKRPDKLRTLGIMALNGMFDEMDAPGVLRQALTDLLAGDVAIVSSFGADSAVLLHMVSEVNPDLPIYFLETGKHFPETLAYVEILKRQLGLTNVISLTPDAADVVRFDPHGDLWETDPDSCCHIRKTEPLEPILEQYGGWVTGRKRYQTKERGVLPHFELTSDDRIKVNPLAYWSDADVVAYRQAHNLPEHPLYGRGYKSIGCAPCTSAVAEGEDARAGRWRGLDKKECGIHFDFNGAIASPMAKVEHNLWKNGGFIADPFHAWSETDDPATALPSSGKPGCIFSAGEASPRMTTRTSSRGTAVSQVMVPPATASSVGPRIITPWPVVTWPIQCFKLKFILCSKLQM